MNAAKNYIKLWLSGQTVDNGALQGALDEVFGQQCVWLTESPAPFPSPAPSSWRESEKVQLAEEEYCEAREAFEVTGHEGDMTPQSEVDRLREVRNAKLDALLEAVASAAPSSSATPPLSIAEKLLREIESFSRTSYAEAVMNESGAVRNFQEITNKVRRYFARPPVAPGSSDDAERDAYMERITTPEALGEAAASSPSAEGTEPPMTGCVNDQFFAARAVFKSHGVTVNPSVLTEALDAAICTFPLYRRSPFPAGTPAQEEK